MRKLKENLSDLADVTRGISQWESQFDHVSLSGVHSTVYTTSCLSFRNLILNIKLLKILLVMSENPVYK